MGVTIEETERISQNLVKWLLSPTWAPSPMELSLTPQDREVSPFVCKIGVNQVIKGWDQGVVKLSLGQKANLICTPDFAYGENGHPPVIPRNATLKFKVELLQIQNA
ncbi:FK506-binding protein 1A [Kwoniella bestiolae CBS 10118]|uniref:peptidylprolyl isomerase n=1 Tax=Kwoniella bestiolae CBS 10118 TaxID=1296100 RepID=A0AAJ8MA11_9TREE